MTKSLIITAALVVCSVASAQQAPQPSAPQSPTPKPKLPKTAPSAAPANSTRYCSKAAGFCLSYPRAWKQLGDLEGTGLVVAQPRQGTPEEAWPQVTASAVDLPDTPQGKEPTSFEDVVNVVLESLGPTAEKQTLSRSALTLGGLPAQRAKVQYKDAQGKSWVEDVVFIDGDDVIFSVSLRCRPEELGPLIPAYEQMLKSWKELEE